MKFLCLIVSFIFPLMIVGFASTSPASGENTVTEQTYREMLPQRWLEYLHALGTVEGKIHYCYIRNGQKKGEFINEFICDYAHLADILGPIEGGSRDVTVTGKDYFFRLERDTPADAWMIERINKGPERKKLSEWGFPQHFSLDRSDPVGYSIFNTLGVGLFADGSVPNLPDIFQSEFFKINKIEFHENEGKKRIFLDFDYTHSDFPSFYYTAEELKNRPDWKPYSLQGQVWLETDYYLIVQGSFRSVCLSNDCRSTVECIYDCDTYKVPLPKKYKLIEHYNFKDDNNKGTLETNIDFDLRETHPRDPKRFTLSAFGLPEPDIGQRRWNFFRIVLMVVGGLMTLAGLWQVWKKRRRRATP